MHVLYPPNPEHGHGVFTPLGRGRSSDVYLHDATVYKVSRKTRTKAAERVMSVLVDEYESVRAYLGDSVVPTTYAVKPRSTDNELFHVVAAQPFIDGTLISDASNPDKPALKQMFEKALDMYDDRSWLPDLACIEHGWFDATRSPNVLVTTDGQPHLLDPNMGRIQRSKAMGAIWNFYISEGVKRALADLQVSSAE